MKYIKPLLLILSLSIVSTAYAENETRNGNWWRTKSESYRLIYTTGFFDSMKLGLDFSQWILKNDRVELSEGASDCGRSYVAISNKYTRNITNDQVADGLTKLYEDFRNRKILIKNAVWLVLQQIAGKSEEEMEKMLQNWRKNVR